MGGDGSSAYKDQEWDKDIVSVCVCICVYLYLLHIEYQSEGIFFVCYFPAYAVKTNLLSKGHFQETSLTTETCGSKHLVMRLQSTSHSFKKEDLELPQTSSFPLPKKYFH